MYLLLVLGTVIFSFVAFFWDEFLLGVIAKLFGFDITPAFLAVWILISGITVIVLIVLHVSPEHRFLVSCICAAVFASSILLKRKRHEIETQSILG